MSAENPAYADTVGATRHYVQSGDGILGHLDAVRDEIVAWEKVSRGTDLDG